MRTVPPTWLPARRRSTKAQDHYYWLTAILAARGLQPKTGRLLALTTFTLGLLPLALAPSGADPRLSWMVAVAIAACCAAIAVMWLRPQWPRRTTSQATSLANSGCIAVFCLVQPDPVVGLLGAMAFLCPTVFISSFHSVQRLVLPWTLAAATLTVLAVRLAPTNVALALSTVVLICIVNTVAALGCAMAFRLIDQRVRHEDIEPLTGLLTREAFEEKVATLIGARSRDDDRYLVVAALTLDGYSLLLSLQGAAGANRARIAIGEQLRNTARFDAMIAHVGEADYLIADLFTTVDPSPMVERVLGAVTGPPSRLSASVGVVSTPLRPLAGASAPDVLDEVLTLAGAAMYDARRAGGNTARYVLNPALAVIDDLDDD